MLSFGAIAIHRRLLWFSVPSQALQVFPLFAIAHAIELMLRMAAGGIFPGFWSFLAPFLEALLWPLASWVLLKKCGEAAARDALRYAAPVGEKETYVQRLIEQPNRLMTDLLAPTDAEARSLQSWQPAALGAAADQLAASLESMGPTFVKLGQLIASSNGLFPERYVNEFQLCLDRVPPEPWPVVVQTLTRALGRPPGEIFASITPHRRRPTKSA